MRPVNQLPLSLIEMKRSPLASSRNPDSPPKPRKLEVRINPLRYSSEPNRTRARSLVSKEGIGRALTSIETGAAIENSSGEGCFGGGCVASCARAICGTAADKSPAAEVFGIHDGDRAAIVARDVVTDADRDQFDRRAGLDFLDDVAQMALQIIAGIDRQCGVINRRAVGNHHQDLALFGAAQ